MAYMSASFFFIQKFFKCGIENIKLNNGENTVSEEHVQAVCRQILEEVCTRLENIKLNNGENSVSEEHVQAVCRQILEAVCIRYREHKTEQW